MIYFSRHIFQLHHMEVHMLSNYILLGNYNNSWDQGEITSWGNAKHELFPVIFLSPIVTEYIYGFTTFSHIPPWYDSQTCLRHRFQQNILRNYLGYTLFWHLVYGQNYQMHKDNTNLTTVTKCSEVLYLGSNCCLSFKITWTEMETWLTLFRWARCLSMMSNNSLALGFLLKTVKLKMAKKETLMFEYVWYW